MSDAQALSRWVTREVAALDPNTQSVSRRYIEAISRLSAHDAIRLFALTLLTGAMLPALDAIKDDAA